MIARSAKEEEFDSVVALINKVFRDTRGHKPTMQQEFPLLLNKNNIKNMIVVEKDNKIVSDVNYLIQDVAIQGTEVKVASIGAVCTDPDYRGERLASVVLDKVEDKMYKDGVDVVSISGSRTLYTRRKCSIPKNFYQYTIYPQNIDIDFEVKEYDDSYLGNMIEIYNQNSTRFLRSRYQFETLLESATIPWGNITYKKLVITKGEDIIGYVVMRVIDEDKIYGEVREMYIDTKCVYDVLGYVANKYNLEHIVTFVHVRDYINQLSSYDKKELSTMDGSIKIINFESFARKLKRYFEQYVDSNIISKIEFREDNYKYIISYEDEELVIDDIDKLNRLFFEGYEVVEKDIKELNVLKDFVMSIFPIHFVWSSNLNYQ